MITKKTYPLVTQQTQYKDHVPQKDDDFKDQLAQRVVSSEVSPFLEEFAICARLATLF
jgi:hypothetical protein